MYQPEYRFDYYEVINNITLIFVPPVELIIEEYWPIIFLK